MSGADAASAALAAMRSRFDGADPEGLLGVSPLAVPAHIAVIMDGNGRWASGRGLRRLEGHREGAERVEELVRNAARFGVGWVTVYAFSSENWSRPDPEVDGLMALLLEHAVGKAGWAIERNVRVRFIGGRDRIPASTLAGLDALAERTASCTGVTLVLAVNYGSRAELATAARRLAERVSRGEREAGAIDEAALGAELATSGMPDPDMVIRTGGERRLSNFLLWQASYSELYFTDTSWPEFGETALADAIRWYASRQRRFGGLVGA